MENVSDLSLSMENLLVSKRLAEAANLRKNKVLGFVAHELKNPLAGLAGFLDMLRQGRAGELNEKQLQYCGHMAGCLTHLQDLSQNLSDVARLEEGNLAFIPDTVSLPALLADVQQVMSETARRRQVSLNMDCAGSLDTVFLDPRWLQQLLVNLLTVALQHAQEAGTIQVCLMREQTWLVGMIHDHGTAIPIEELPALLMEYYRINSYLAPRQAADNALAYGLGFAQKLITLQGGLFEVSSNPEAGNTYRFKLPAC